MNKKILFITIGLGAFGFAGMFSFAWFSKAASQTPADDPAVIAARNADAALKEMQAASAAKNDTFKVNGAVRSLTEKQLKSLVYEVRDKIEDYNARLKELDLREQRLKMAQDALRKDIDEMSSLRVELASAVSTLKTEQDNLIKSKVEIEKIEQENLQLMAATYDKMESEAAGKIISNMIQTQRQGTGFDDAVKILYYMQERTKANVLASISETEPSVSAIICQRLKHTIESK